MIIGSVGKTMVYSDCVDLSVCVVSVKRRFRNSIGGNWTDFRPGLSAFGSGNNYDIGIEFFLIGYCIVMLGC